MSIKPRPQIEKLEICAHGGPNEAELSALGLKVEDVVDFSVSSNPFSCSAAVLNAVKEAVIDRYPDSESTALRKRLSEELSVSPENILVGSGSMEVIRLAAQAYFAEGDTVLILKPTFGEYEVACRVAGALVEELWAEEEKGFCFDIDAAVEAIKRHHPKGVFICNPNNPVGDYLSRKDIEKVLNACGDDSLLIMDEAYIAFTEGEWPAISLIGKGNLICLRSMTKDYALAGLRLGYAVASAEVIRNLRRVCPPWNVNDVAQRAGLAALKDGEYLKECEVKIRQARNYLADEMSQMGYKVLPSNTNFFMAKVGDAKAFRAALLKDGLMVRDCTSFGLPQYVRIAARTMPECQQLIKAIGKIAGGKSGG